MALRSRLFSWQYAGYGVRHRHRINLWLHAVAVPLFWAGLLALVVAVRRSDAWILAGGVIAVFLSFSAQGFGHRFERVEPEPFTDRTDFVVRFVAEQMVTFPRFVLAGCWFRALLQGAAARR